MQKILLLGVFILGLGFMVVGFSSLYKSEIKPVVKEASTGTPIVEQQSTKTPNALKRFSEGLDDDLSERGLKAFSSEVSERLFTFGFHDYPVRLQDCSYYFTKSGWEEMLQILSERKFMDPLVQNKQVMHASAIKTPVIILDENTDFKWHVETPIKVQIESGSTTDVNNYVVEMTILYTEKDGIQIDNITLHNTDSRIER